MSQLITGAKTAVFINGLPFGRCSSFKWNSDTPRKKIFAVDSTTAFELGITTSSITGSMTVYRLSLDGGAEGAGMVAPVSILSTEKYFSLFLIDTTTGATLFRADQCSVDSQAWDDTSRTYLIGNITWSALSYSNEVIP